MRDSSRQSVSEVGEVLAEMYVAGHVRPYIGAKFAFAELPAALALLERGEVPGKAVVQLDGDAEQRPRSRPAG